MKKCSKCGELKPLDEFPKHKGKRDGLGSQCNVCHRKRSREWAANNIEKVLKNVYKWTAAHPEKVREIHRKWHAAHPDCMRKADQKYKENHRDKLLERARVWTATYPEKTRERNRKWRASHPEKMRENNRNRRALRKGAGGKITTKEWYALKEFYNFTCLCCGRREPEIELTIDHVIPLKRGGKNVIENAQPLCRSCNCSKQAKHIDYRVNFVSL